MENNNSNKQSDNSKVILVAVILILIGVIGYLVFSNQKKDDTIAAKDEQISIDSIEKAKTLKEYQELQLHYQKLKEENQALGLQTDSLDAKILELNQTMNRVRSANAAEIKKLKANLAQLKTDYDKVKFQLDSVVATNDTLRVKLEDMRQKDVKMTDSLKNLNTVKSELAEKVAIASILKAENIKITVINHKDKELDDDVYKAKNIEKVKIIFTLAENKVAKKNSKEVYLRIIEPSGATLYDGDKTFMVDGKETLYTDKKSFTFDNSRQQIAFIYQKGSTYAPGKYTVQLYVEGNMIGESNFSVK